MEIARQFRRRLFGALLVAGGMAVGVAAAISATSARTAAPPTNTGVAVPPADTGRYGSGTLDSWAGCSERISTPQIIRAVVAQDGILAFGDSIGVSTFADLATRLYSSGTQLAMNAKGGRPTAPTVDLSLIHISEPTRL